MGDEKSILEIYENDGEKIFTEKNIIIEDEYKIRKGDNNHKQL